MPEGKSSQRRGGPVRGKDPGSQTRCLILEEPFDALETGRRNVRTTKKLWTVGRRRQGRRSFLSQGRISFLRAKERGVSRHGRLV